MSTPHFGNEIIRILRGNVMFELFQKTVRLIDRTTMVLKPYWKLDQKI